MKALIWVGAILLVLVLIALLRLRVSAAYGESGARMTVALGALPILSLPTSKEKKKPKAPKKEKKKKKKKAETEEKPSGGPVGGFRDWIPIIRDALGRLKRRLTIDELTLWYQSAAADPAAAALAYGGASAAASALARPLQELFRIKDLDLRSAVSFTETRPKVYARLRMSIPLGALVWIALRALIQKRRAGRKARPKNREESSWKSTGSEN